MSTPFYDLASLVLVPSGYKAQKGYAQKPLTTDGQLTFSRASTATRVNSAGLIETVSSNVPRLDYLGSTCPKLQLEPQRSNIVLQSSAFDNASWLTVNCTATANFAVSPDGTTNAEKIDFNASSDSSIYQALSGSSAAYSISIFAKYVSGGKYLYIFSPLNSDSAKVWFDIQAGTVANQVSGFTGKIENYGNGWFRCTLTNTSNKSLDYMQFGISSTSSSRTLSSASVTYLYGAQVEAGAYPTSLIQTTTAAVTRLEDAFYKNSISSLIGQSSGVVFADIVPSQFSDGSYIGISDNTAVNRQIFGFEGDSGNSGTLRFYGAFGGSAGTFYVGQRYKIAMAYANNDFVVYVNGTQLFSLSSGTMSGTLSHFGFDSYFAQAQTFQGKVNQALLFKTRLTNAQLAELTTL